MSCEFKEGTLKALSERRLRELLLMHCGISIPDILPFSYIADLRICNCLPSIQWQTQLILTEWLHYVQIFDSSALSGYVIILFDPVICNIGDESIPHIISLRTLKSLTLGTYCFLNRFQSPHEHGSPATPQTTLPLTSQPSYSFPFT